MSQATFQKRTSRQPDGMSRVKLPSDSGPIGYRRLRHLPPVVPRTRHPMAHSRHDHSRQVDAPDRSRSSKAHPRLGSPPPHPTVSRAAIFRAVIEFGSEADCDRDSCRHIGTDHGATLAAPLAGSSNRSSRRAGRTHSSVDRLFQPPPIHQVRVEHRSAVPGEPTGRRVEHSTATHRGTRTGGAPPRARHIARYDDSSRSWVMRLPTSPQMAGLPMAHLDDEQGHDHDCICSPLLNR